MSKETVVIFRASTIEKRTLRDLAQRQGTTVSNVLRALVATAASAGQAQAGSGK